MQKNGNTRVLSHEVVIAKFNLRGQKPCIDVERIDAEKTQAVFTLDAA